MAQQLIPRNLCDWHRSLPDSPQIEATTQRHINAEKELDLCGFCALIWDMVFPRRDELLQMLDHDVIEVLMRSAHNSPKNPTPPAQLTLPPANDTPRDDTPATTTKTTDQTTGSGRGRWLDGIDQIHCPLNHPSTPSGGKYWVRLRDRHSHAHGSHNLMGPQIPYELPDDGSLTLDYKCHAHVLCDSIGGYGHKTAGSLATHKYKAAKAGWELTPEGAAEAAAAGWPVPPKDTTETAAASEPAT